MWPTTIMPIINFLLYTNGTSLTNSIIFEKEKLTVWWEVDLIFGKHKNSETQQIETARLYEALVISGGGSKGGPFAGGVAQYLMEVEKREYDILVGTSTGKSFNSAIGFKNKIGKLYDIYTNVNQRSIFYLNPFIVNEKRAIANIVSIKFFGRKTFSNL